MCNELNVLLFPTWKMYVFNKTCLSGHYYTSCSGQSVSKFGQVCGRILKASQTVLLEMFSIKSWKWPLLFTFTSKRIRLLKQKHHDSQEISDWSIDNGSICVRTCQQIVVRFFTRIRLRFKREPNVHTF